MRSLDKLQRQAGGHRGQFLGLIPVDAGPFSRQGDGPVHRPGVEEAEAQPPGQSAGGAALSGAGGAVDGHNHGSGQARNQAVMAENEATPMLWGRGRHGATCCRGRESAEPCFPGILGRISATKPARFGGYTFPCPRLEWQAWGESVPRA